MQLIGSMFKLIFFSFHFLSIYSEERAKAIQYILSQREQIDELIDEKQSVNKTIEIFSTNFFICKFS
jgi:hypothetical protein